MSRRCDPHRPRRVGAAVARLGLPVEVQRVAILTDPGGSVLRRRSSSNWSDTRVAILTDPGGSVLLRGRRLGRPGLEVAILTDPGGSVLHSTSTLGAPLWFMLRSSPPRRVGAASSRSSRRPVVAILTDPGGSVLLRGRRRVGVLRDLVVAILTGPVEPGAARLRSSRVGAARPRRAGPGAGGRGCDPHRPRRVGAAVTLRNPSHVLFLLMSRPPP